MMLVLVLIWRKWEDIKKHKQLQWELFDCPWSVINKTQIFNITLSHYLQDKH